MKHQLILFSCLLLVVNGWHLATTDEECDERSRCAPWLTCVDGKCTRCKKAGVACDPSDGTWGCCKGFTCTKVPGLNSSICEVSSKCTKDQDCQFGLRCVQRLGECGVCKSDYSFCTLPYDSGECCSNYCSIFPDHPGIGVCKSL